MTLSHRRIPSLVVLALAGIVTLLLVAPFYEAFHYVSHNYNEGWIASHTLRAVQGENPYATQDRFITFNYPPLFLYIVALFGRVTPDFVFAARLASVVGLFGMVTGVAVATWTITREWFCAAISALCLMLIMATYFNEYVAMGDPQIFAHAVALPALVIFLTRPDSRTALLAVALLLVTAGFIKHNLVSLPLAITASLAIYDRRRLLDWVAYGAVLTAVGLAVCVGAFGWDFFASLLRPVRYSIERLGRLSTQYLTMLQLPIAFWLFSLPFGKLDRRTATIGLYIILSTAFGIYFFGADGVNYNVFFDLAIGLAIAVGMGLGRIERTLVGAGQPQARARGIIALAAVLVCAGPLIASPAGIYRLVRTIRTVPGWVVQTHADVAFLRDQPGPVLCYRLELCYRAGKGFEVDLFNAAQRVAFHAIDPEIVYNRIRQGEYSVIQLGTERFSDEEPEFLRTLGELTQEYYSLVRHTVNGYFYEPRAQAATPP